MNEATFRIGNSRGRLLAALERLAAALIRPEDDWELVFRRARKEKTHQQRKAWHALLTEFGRAVGYTMPEMKDVVKRELMGSHKVKLPSGKEYEVFPSSEDEDRFGYSELIEGTMRIAAREGVYLQIKSAA